MAAIDRQTFAEMRDEALKRAGRFGATGAAARMEELVYAAYLTLALTYFHHELLATGNDTLTSGTRTLTLSTDLYALVAVRLEPAGGGTHKALSGANLSSLWLDDLASAEPQRFARVGSDLEFDRDADANYTIRWLYYKQPAAVDFATSATSALGWAWDEYIIELATSLYLGTVWRFDLAGAATIPLTQWLKNNAHPSLVEAEVARHGDRLRDMDAIGKGLG